VRVMSGKLEEVDVEQREVELKDKPFDRYGNYTSANIQSKHFTALFNHITGKVLTIVDATNTDREQRDALKQLIKQTIWNDYETLQDWMWRQHNGEGSTFPF